MDKTRGDNARNGSIRTVMQRMDSDRNIKKMRTMDNARSE